MQLPKIKNFIFQALSCLAFMHQNGIFHRDIKPFISNRENLLVSENNLKIADFGSCKSTDSKPPHTGYISTRWYRPPESLLTRGFYNEKMDIWAIGFVLYEITTSNPLFPGSSKNDQIHKIHNILGTPTIELLSKFKMYYEKAKSTRPLFIFTENWNRNWKYYLWSLPRINWPS